MLNNKKEEKYVNIYLRGCLFSNYWNFNHVWLNQYHLFYYSLASVTFSIRPVTGADF